jgi:hypothetical protein
VKRKRNFKLKKEKFYKVVTDLGSFTSELVKVDGKNVEYKRN